MQQNQQQDITHDILVDKIVELLRDASEYEMDLIWRVIKKLTG